MTDPEKELRTPVAVVQAAKALVEKLRAIHDDPAYQSVWTISQLHAGPYRGPTYVSELDDLTYALEHADAIIGAVRRLRPDTEGWRTIDSAPKDGTWFVAVFLRNTDYSAAPHVAMTARLIGEQFETFDLDKWVKTGTSSWVAWLPFPPNDGRGNLTSPPHTQGTQVTEEMAEAAARAVAEIGPTCSTIFWMAAVTGNFGAQSCKRFAPLYHGRSRWLKKFCTAKHRLARSFTTSVSPRFRRNGWRENTVCH